MGIEGADRQAPEERKAMLGFWLAVVGVAVAIVVPAPDMEGASGDAPGTKREEACTEVYTAEGSFRACGLPWCDPGHPGTCVTPLPTPLPQRGVRGQ